MTKKVDDKMSDEETETELKHGRSRHMALVKLQIVLQSHNTQGHLPECVSVLVCAGVPPCIVFRWPSIYIYIYVCECLLI